MKSTAYKTTDYVVPRPSVNTWHFRVPSAVGCCGVFFAPTVLRRGSATMTLRRVGRLSGASRQGGPNLWAIALLSLARRLKTIIPSRKATRDYGMREKS